MNYGVNWRRHRPRVSFIWNNLWPLGFLFIVSSSSRRSTAGDVSFLLRVGHCHSTLIHPRPRKIRNILAFQFDTVAPDTRHVITSMSLHCPIILDNLARSYTRLFGHTRRPSHYVISSKERFRFSIARYVSKIRILWCDWFVLVIRVCFVWEQ